MELSEQYQFLRYYIPGSLSLVYLLILIAANVDGKIFNLLARSGGAVLPSVLGAFALSPAIGYMIYQFYDYLLYNRIARCSERGALNLLDKWAEEAKLSEREQWEKRKELIDFALYTDMKESSFYISVELMETLRGFWSHVNARLVSSVFVPFASLVFFLILWVVGLPISYDPLRTFVAFVLIEGLSVLLAYPARRTIKEAFALEEYVVRAKEESIKRYLGLENKQHCLELKREFKKRCDMEI